MEMVIFIVAIIDIVGFWMAANYLLVILSDFKKSLIKYEDLYVLLENKITIKKAKVAEKTKKEKRSIEILTPMTHQEAEIAEQEQNNN